MPIVALSLAILLLFYYFYRLLLSSCVCQLLINSLWWWWWWCSRYSNGKYHDVLQNCIVTKITTVKTEEHVTKMSITNTRASVNLALPEDTVKAVSSIVALLILFCLHSSECYRVFLNFEFNFFWSGCPRLHQNSNGHQIVFLVLVLQTLPPVKGKTHMQCEYRWFAGREWSYDTNPENEKFAHITVCTIVQNFCKGRSNKYRKWNF